VIWSEKVKVFVKNKAKVVSGVGCSETAVVCFRQLLFKSNKRKFRLKRFIQLVRSIT